METTELTRDKLTNRIKLHHEQIFYKTGHLPRNSDVQETFSRELASLDLEYYELLPQITQWLKKNGLLEQDQHGLLDPKQFLVAQMFLDTMDRRSIRQKLKAADVTVTEFNNWRRSPSFMNFLRSEAQRRFADADISADLELVKNVEDGNLDAIKY